VHRKSYIFKKQKCFRICIGGSSIQPYPILDVLLRCEIYPLVVILIKRESFIRHSWSLLTTNPIQSSMFYCVVNLYLLVVILIKRVSFIRHSWSLLTTNPIQSSMFYSIVKLSAHCNINKEGKLYSSFMVVAHNHPSKILPYLYELE